MPVDWMPIYDETEAGAMVVSDLWLDAGPSQEVLDRLSAERPPMGVLLVTWNVLPATEAGVADAQRSRFEEEKSAFGRHLPELKRRFPGRFVAVHGGEIADADSSSAVLVRRFFERFGEVSVYVGYVGGKRIIRNISPRIRRRS